MVFSPKAIEWWDHLHFLGFHNVAPIGGSDDHHGGQNETRVGPWEVGSPIGHPATMVLAANLSHAAIREALLLGRTAIKMASALDPMVDLTASLSTGGGASRVGGTLVALTRESNVSLEITVTLPRNTTTAGVTAARSRSGGRVPTAPGAAVQVQFVRNNEVFHRENIVLLDASSTVQLSAPVPWSGTDRWRAEVHDLGEDGTLRTLTNHIFVVSAAATIQEH
jgi:hypothetical protein